MKGYAFPEDRRLKEEPVMGVKEQAEYAAALVYRDLSDRMESLHAEIHTLSTRLERLQALVHSRCEPVKAPARSRTSGT